LPNISFSLYTYEYKVVLLVSMCKDNLIEEADFRRKFIFGTRNMFLNQIRKLMSNPLKQLNET